jgi:hypothetical protein
MDTQTHFAPLIKNIINQYAQYQPSHGEIHSYVTFDDEHGNYALLEAGWQGDKYIHHTIIHVGLLEQKIWIHCDNTEEGIATELVEAGISKENIVLGFRPPEVRQYTKFAAN